MHRLILLLLFVSPWIPGCQSAPTPLGDPTDSTPATTAPAAAGALTGSRAILVVYGMGCPMCARNVDKQLLQVPGVQKVRVDLGTGNVVVAFNPDGAHPTREQLAEAVRKSGFTLHEIVQP